MIFFYNFLQLQIELQFCNNKLSHGVIFLYLKNVIIKKNWELLFSNMFPLLCSFIFGHEVQTRMCRTCITYKLYKSKFSFKSSQKSNNVICGVVLINIQLHPLLQAEPANTLNLPSLSNEACGMATVCEVS